MTIITLPLPPPECAPNSRHHWQARARAVKKYRAECGWAARAALGHVSVPDRATVQITFYHVNRRRRDPDNLLGQMKAALDGLTDGGAWKDDARLTHLPVRQEIDPARPRVEVAITQEIKETV